MPGTVVLAGVLARLLFDCLESEIDHYAWPSSFAPGLCSTTVRCRNSSSAAAF